MLPNLLSGHITRNKNVAQPEFNQAEMHECGRWTISCPPDHSGETKTSGQASAASTSSGWVPAAGFEVFADLAFEPVAPSVRMSVIRTIVRC